MPRVLRLPVQFNGALIHGCWGCPFFDGSSPKDQHCNLKEHFGVERTHPLDDGFEIGCPLEDAPDGQGDSSAAVSGCSREVVRDL